MDFCDNCFNLLFTKEILQDNNKKLIYYCNNCDFQKDCNNFLILKRKYKNTNKTYNNDIDYNKILINDNTLPTVNIKCNHCKKKNNNKYEIKYYDNSYHKHIICINCFKNIN